MDELPSVGRSIYIEDKKTNSGQWYTVVAHVDARTAKLKSETTGRSKTYKLPKPNSGTTRTASQRNTTRIVPSWSELKQRMDDSTPSQYRMIDKYEVESVIEHPKFGLGFVLAKNDRTIEAIFEDGVRQLIHNRS